MNVKWKSDWVYDFNLKPNNSLVLPTHGRCSAVAAPNFYFEVATWHTPRSGHWTSRHQGILIHGSTKPSLKFLNFLQSLLKSSVQKALSYHTYHILTGLPKCNYSHHCLQSVNAVMLFVFYVKNTRPKFLLLPLMISLNLLPLEKISWLSSVNKLQKIIAPGPYRHFQVSVTCQAGCSQESGKSELADEAPGLLGVFFIR